MPAIAVKPEACYFGMMPDILHDEILFPLLQLSLVAFGLICWWNNQTTPRNGVISEVIRGESSMAKLGVTAGFLIGLITLINQSAFSNGNPDSWYAGYSLVFIAIDVAVVVYVCFRCSWSRKKVLELFEIARREKE